MTKDLTEIVVRDDNQLERVIEKALRSQNEEENYSKLNREELYEIASEINVDRKYIEEAINGGKIYDVDSEECIFELTRILRLEEKEDETLEKKKRKVHKTLSKILKQAKKFKPKIYSIEEIEAIYKKYGIFIDGNQLVRKKLNPAFSHNYYFSEIIYSKEKKKYKLKRESLL